MKTRYFFLIVALVGGLVVLPGCKSKAEARKIKELEAELTVANENFETLQREHKDEIDGRDEQTAKLEQDFEKEMQILRKERDEALAQHQEAARTLRQLESRIATLPRAARAGITGEEVPTDAALDPSRQEAMVQIEGDVSKGSGFIVGLGDKRYLYTAAHVLSGNQKLTITSAGGRKFSKFGNLEAADGADLIRLEILDAGDAPFLTLAAADAPITPGAAIVALGQGGDQAKGTIQGQKEDSLEVSYGVIQAARGGSPVLDATEGTVLGLVTQLPDEARDLWSTGERFGEPQRFACRLNREWNWQALPIGNFLGEPKRLADYDRLTRVGRAVASLSVTPEGLRSNGGVNDAMNILNDAQDLPFVADFVKMNTDLSARRMRSSESDLNRRFRSMVETTASAVKRNGEGFDPARFTWYHRKQAETSAGWRTETDDALRKSIESLGQ